MLNRAFFLLVGVFLWITPARGEIAAEYHTQSEATAPASRPDAAVAPYHASDPSTLPSLDYGFTEFRLMNKEDGGKFLHQEDDFIRSLNGLNRSLTLGTPARVSEQQYLDYVANQALDITPDQKEKISSPPGASGQLDSTLGPQLAPAQNS